MLRLIVLTYCLTAAAAQQYFYCNTINPVTVTEREFFLVTRRPTETGYSAGLSCEFNAESDNDAFFVEIQSFKLSTAIFTISSGDRTLFRGSSIEAYQSSITTPSKSLQVRFDATGDYSNSDGVKIRVRMMNSNGCPPGWIFLYNNCFGTSTTSPILNFVDSQKACNSMRSNLLQLPSNHLGSLRSFVQMLPINLRTYYTYVGVSDRRSMLQFYWLNGVRQSNTSELGCVSGGSSIFCYVSERCGAIYESIYDKRHIIFMSKCDDKRVFACSMPPGGTDHFYYVPEIDEEDEIRVLKWIPAIVGACVFVVGVIFFGIYYVMRSRALRAAGAGGVVVSAGRVAVPPPAGSYPMQQTQYPGPPPVSQGQSAPPAYSTAVGGSHGNGGYMYVN